MNLTNTANAYKAQQIMTATPEQLTLMLYNGAIKFVNESIKALEQSDFEKANTASLRVQDIVREFMGTLDMSYELSDKFMVLYEYALYQLIQGNIKKDKNLLEEAKHILTEFRDTWAEAMKKARSEQVQHTGHDTSQAAVYR